jgi:hypothetical protein
VTTPERQDITLLREYLAARDAPCPRCGYNLRGLTDPVCPECGGLLLMSMLADRPLWRTPYFWRYGWGGAGLHIAGFALIVTLMLAGPVAVLALPALVWHLALVAAWCDELARGKRAQRAARRGSLLAPVALIVFAVLWALMVPILQTGR